MKLIRVHPSIESYAGARTNYQDHVTVAVQSWYENPIFWISAITALGSVLALIQQYHPSFAWVGLVGGILNIASSFLENTVIPSNVVR